MQLAMQDALVEQIEIAGTLDTVWTAITDPQQLRQWWNCGDSHMVSWEQDLKTGGELKVRWEDSKGEAALLNGKFLVVDPPRSLVYTWESSWVEHPTSKVTWELKPTAKGTHVTVTHSGLRGYPEAINDFGGGWPGVLQHLSSFIANQ
jgi:uncharacterized protein YndB with AHSA1/START domain